MKKFKIHILGPSGAGTSTLGKALSSELGIPWFDSDDIFWQPADPPFSKPRPKEERIGMLEEINRNNPSWIISGSMLEWGDFLRNDMNLIIYLYVEKEIRIQRLRAREKSRFGDRIMYGNDMHERHEAFIKWAESYEDGGLEMRSARSEKLWMSQTKCTILRIEKEISVETEVRLTKDILGL